MTVFLAHSRRFAAACLLLCACAARAHDGDLDPTFGVAGVTHTGWYNLLLNAIALRSDGRFVACGQYDAPSGSSSELIVVQFLADGTLDTSFGTAGMAAVDFGPSDDICTGIAIQTDGRAVVVGYAQNLVGFPPVYSYHPIAARLTSAGALDASFGNGAGQVQLPQQGGSQAVALQADGKIVIAGFEIPEGDNGTDYGIERLLADGSVDPGFGTEGRVTVDFAGSPSFEMPSAVAIDAQARIVVAGTSDRYLDAGMGIVRLLGNGQFDDTFGSNGVVVAGLDAEHIAYGYALHLEGNGGVVVGGMRSSAKDLLVAAARLLENGSMDATFGTQGVATIPYAPAGVEWNPRTYAMARQSDGKYVLAGSVVDPDGKQFTLLARIDAEGQLDPTFADAGTAVFDFVGSADAIQYFSAMTLSAGRVLAAGGLGNPNEVRDMLVRLQSDLIFLDGF